VQLAVIVSFVLAPVVVLVRVVQVQYCWKCVVKGKKQLVSQQWGN